MKLITVVTAAALTVTSAEAGDFERSLFYSSLHAGNVATTEWALKQGPAGSTSESHTWLGMSGQWNRIAVHSAAAFAQVAIDHELSKPKHPKWQVWGFRVLSVGIQGWAASKDYSAGLKARQIK